MTPALRRLACGYGRIALCDLPADGDVDAPAGGGPPDLVVQQDDTLRMPAPPPDTNWVAQGTDLWLEIPGIAQVRLSREPAGRGATADLPGIRYRPVCADAVAALAGLLQDILLPLWCHWNGDVLLRGTLVRKASTVVLLASRAGCDTSTLAAALAGRGFEVLGDRAARLDASPGDVLQAWPSGLPLRMRWQEFEALGLRDLRGSALRPRIQVHRSTPTPPIVTAPVPLTSLVFLGSRHSKGSAAPEPVGLMQGVQLFRSHSWQPSLACQPDLWARHARLAATGVRRGQVARWDLDRDLGHRHACAGALASAWPSSPPPDAGDAPSPAALP